MSSDEKKQQLLMCERGVRAICERRKWQTRRMPACLSEINIRPDEWIVRAPGGEPVNGTRRWELRNTRTGEEVVVDSPYGGAKSMLWIREPWSFHGGRITFTASDPVCGDGFEPEPEMLETLAHFKRLEGGHPSLHLPNWAARFLVFLTSVQLERLNDLTESDAREEGAESVEDFLLWFADLHGPARLNPWLLVLKWETILVGQGRDKKLVEKPGRV